ncbi:hypothetical protein CERSUDRAFT_116102 [Gelatoporia subvermispora B]|uniref:Uncharacterized protein n=1 Tax=Ceriporiopsis subvermispora (strain B) TaxID=914234 RepID=M2QE21_CERS8|nr:hypothetical protein CERSUDRAFT_116102 [Gelatoporia subvermispora B]
MDFRTVSVQLSSEAAAVMARDGPAFHIITAASQRYEAAVVSLVEQEKQRVRKELCAQLAELRRIHENAKLFVRNAEDRADKAEREIVGLRSELVALRVQLQKARQELSRSKERTVSAERERDGLLDKVASQDRDIATMSSRIVWLETNMNAGPSWSADKTDDVMPGILSNASKSSYRPGDENLVATGLCYVDASQHDNLFEQFMLSSPAREPVSDSAIIEFSQLVSTVEPSGMIIDIPPEVPPSPSDHSSPTPPVTTLVPDAAPPAEPEAHHDPGEPNDDNDSATAQPRLPPRRHAIRIPSTSKQLVIHLAPPPLNYRRSYCKTKFGPLHREERASSNAPMERNKIARSALV